MSGVDPRTRKPLGVRARWRVAGGGGALRPLRPCRARQMRGGMRGGLDAACAPGDRAGGGRPRRLFGRGGREPARCGPETRPLPLPLRPPRSRVCSADLDVLANLAPEFEPARIRRVGEAGDIRLAWTIADMMRFVPREPSETQRALVAAFSETDGTTGGSHRLLGRRQQPPDIERHPRTGRVPQWKGTLYTRIRRGVGAVL